MGGSQAAKAARPPNPQEFSIEAASGLLNCDRSENPSFSTLSAHCSRCRRAVREHALGPTASSAFMRGRPGPLQRALTVSQGTPLLPVSPALSSQSQAEPASSRRRRHRPGGGPRAPLEYPGGPIGCSDQGRRHALPKTPPSHAVQRSRGSVRFLRRRRERERRHLIQSTKSDVRGEVSVSDVVRVFGRAPACGRPGPLRRQRFPRAYGS